MWAEVRGADPGVLRSDLVLWCHGTSLALNLLISEVGTDGRMCGSCASVFMKQDKSICPLRTAVNEQEANTSY